MSLADTLSISTLLDIAEQVGVINLMAERKSNRIVVDYVPARTSIALPREPNEDPELEVFPPTVTPLTYTLDDAMFGGSVYVALTCCGRVLIHPFVFVNWDTLARQVQAGHLKRGS